jgi:hypothetical protein
MTEGTVKQYNQAGVFVVAFDTAASMTGSQVTTEAFGFDFRVIDFWTHKIGAGGAADTLILKAVAVDGTTERSITDTLDTNKTDPAVTRAGGINDANSDIVQGEKLRVESASDSLDRCYALCMRI